MPPNSRAAYWALSLALAVVGTCAPGRADTATPPSGLQTYVGVQGLMIVGDHQDVAGTQHGIGGAPLIELRVGTPRVVLHLEGFPVVSAPQRASAFYGQATPAVGIVFSSLETALDPNKRIWFGAGDTIINQRTPLPNILQVVSSRLSGARFTLQAHEPLHQAGRFVEAYVGGSPALSGTDHFLYSNGLPAVNKPERASEIDASIAYGVQRHGSQWLFGLRTLNYSSHFILTGEAADRNVGIGPMIEWRHLLSH